MREPLIGAGVWRRDRRDLGRLAAYLATRARALLRSLPRCSSRSLRRLGVCAHATRWRYAALASAIAIVRRIRAVPPWSLGSTRRCSRCLVLGARRGAARSAAVLRCRGCRAGSWACCRRYAWVARARRWSPISSYVLRDRRRAAAADDRSSQRSRVRLPRMRTAMTTASTSRAHDLHVAGWRLLRVVQAGVLENAAWRTVPPGVLRLSLARRRCSIWRLQPCRPDGGPVDAHGAVRRRHRGRLRVAACRCVGSVRHWSACATGSYALFGTAPRGRCGLSSGRPARDRGSCRLALIGADTPTLRLLWAVALAAAAACSSRAVRHLPLQGWRIARSTERVSGVDWIPGRRRSLSSRSRCPRTPAGALARRSRRALRPATRSALARRRSGSSSGPRSRSAWTTSPRARRRPAPVSRARRARGRARTEGMAASGRALRSRARGRVPRRRQRRRDAGIRSASRSTGVRSSCHSLSLALPWALRPLTADTGLNRRRNRDDPSDDHHREDPRRPRRSTTEVEPGQLINCKLDLVLANDVTAPIAIKEFAQDRRREGLGPRPRSRSCPTTTRPTRTSSPPSRPR